MRIKYASIIATAIVLSFGVLIILSPLINATKQQPVLLSFEINNENNLPQWCDGVSSILKKYDISATIFAPGDIASSYPGCFKNLPHGVDIGSETFHYVDLTNITDYEEQINEVVSGKKSIDNAAGVNSKLFKAPYGKTDQNIYSLLTKAGILADLSYVDHYNKYYNGQFIKFDLDTYNGSSLAADLLHSLHSPNPILIKFDSSDSLNSIDDVISHLKAQRVQFLTVSEITGLNLTDGGLN